MTRSSFTTATLLTAAGAIPFLATLAIIITQPTNAPAATVAMITYGACILSFLGAVHWGFALEPGGIVNDPKLNHQRLAFGVAPALIAWAALLILTFAAAPRAATAVLIAGFFATIIGETIGRGRNLVASNYLALRWTISILVLAVLIITLFIEIIGMRHA
ncbi:DUF3429 domain-containing protein [Acidiphilium acidophilum]|uniref:DUF3429 domain-containing protein n=1 Tax=Acidiphilium acidophilum TaxID=76588 RepID=UPI002E8E7265|nr:DUF3429 domain-containing protein [Acidiphilium acidophilum]